MLLRGFAVLVVLTVPTFTLAQDVVSGPSKEQKVPALKVQAVTGPHQGNTLDYAAERKDAVTIYLFIPQDKFSRPMHRFLKTLGEAMQKEFDDGLIVAVWLTSSPEKTKDYLPRISNYYQSTVLTYYAGGATGPSGWNLNDLADVTIVLGRNGQVVASLGYNSINETAVREIMQKLYPPGKGK